MTEAGFDPRADGPFDRVPQAGGASIYTVLYAHFDRLGPDAQQHFIDSLQHRKNAQQVQRMKGN